MAFRSRLSLNGVEVVQPVGRTTGDVLSFLHANGLWIVNQPRRAERLQKIRVPERRKGEILYRGEIVETDPAALPLGILVRKRRQRLERARKAPVGSCPSRARVRSIRTIASYFPAQKAVLDDRATDLGARTRRQIAVGKV
jgi:hypothetical protein